MSDKKLTVHCSHGMCSELHDKREYTPLSADKSLRNRNVTVLRVESDKDSFNNFFEPTIQAYNDSQKRSDRKKGLDYYSFIENESKNGEHPFYEYTVGFGNRDTEMGVTDKDFDVKYWRKLKLGYTDENGVVHEPNEKEASKYVQQHLNDSDEHNMLVGKLAEFCESLPERYPNFQFTSIEIHADEPNAAVHAHVRFFPVGEGYKTGLSKRCSLTKALENMGIEKIKPSGLDANYSCVRWTKQVEDELEEHLNAFGYERDFSDGRSHHYAVDELEALTDVGELTDLVEKVIAQNEQLQEDNAQLQAKNSELEEQQVRLKKVVSQEKGRATKAKNEADAAEQKAKEATDKWMLYYDLAKTSKAEVDEAELRLGDVQKRNQEIDEREDAVARREIALSEKQSQFEQDAARKKKIIARFCKAKFGTSDVYDELETELIKAERSHEIRHRPMIDTSGIEGGSGIDFSLRPY